MQTRIFGARVGVAAALAALDAAPDGLPMTVLIEIVAHIGNVTTDSAYQALRDEFRLYTPVRVTGESCQGGISIASQVITVREPMASPRLAAASERKHAEVRARRAS